MHIVVVEVPVEVGLPLAFQHRKQPLLHRLQQIEAYEEVMVGILPQLMKVGGVFHHTSVECSLVGYLQLLQPLVVTMVDVTNA